MLEARSGSYGLIFKHKPFRVIVSIITLGVFLFTTFSQDLAWAAKGPMELASLGSKGAGSPGSFRELNVGTFSIPAYLGRIKDVWQPASSTLRRGQRANNGLAQGESLPSVVIHIQDAHCNYYAQHRISEIIEYLNTNYGVSTINLEGGAKGYDLGLFTDIADKSIREKVADYFVKEGMVNGSEYYAINNPDKVNLWGIEDTGLYLENLKVYKDSLKHKDEIDKYLRSLSYVLNNLEPKIYSKELFEFDLKYSAYKAEKLEFKDYLNYLIAKAKEKIIDVKSFNNICILTQTLDEETGIDFRKANRERDALMDAVQKKLSRNALSELVAKAVEFKRERISQRDFYANLTDKAKKQDIELANYPELQKYILYVSMYEAIDKTKIMEEVNALEDRIKEALYKNDKDRKLSELSKTLALMKNIFNISLSIDDYRFYKANESDFDIKNYTKFIEKEAPLYGITARPEDSIERLDTYREDISKFYECSFKRDKAFVKNLRFNPSKPTTNDQRPTTIIVTGGFHTENLAELFKKDNIAYISIMPNFKNCDGYECPYFKILSGDKYINIAGTLPSVLKNVLAIPAQLSPDMARAANAAGIYSDFAAPRRATAEEIVKEIFRGDTTAEDKYELALLVLGKKPLYYQFSNRRDIDHDTARSLARRTGLSYLEIPGIPDVGSKPATYILYREAMIREILDRDPEIGYAGQNLTSQQIEGVLRSLFRWNRPGETLGEGELAGKLIGYPANTPGPLNIEFTLGDDGDYVYGYSVARNTPEIEEFTRRTLDDLKMIAGIIREATGEAQEIKVAEWSRGTAPPARYAAAAPSAPYPGSAPVTTAVATATRPATISDSVASYLKGLGINLEIGKRHSEGEYSTLRLNVNNSNRLSLFQTFGFPGHDDVVLSVLFYKNSPIGLILNPPKTSGIQIGCVALADPQDEEGLAENESRIREYFKDSARELIYPGKIELEPETSGFLKRVTGKDGPALVGFPGVFPTDFDSEKGETSKAIVEEAYPLIKGGDRVLVVGCGRGIDVIAAALSKAGSVETIDLSEFEIENTRLNLKRWGLEGRVKLTNNDGLEGLGKYDVIIFNAPLIASEPQRGVSRLAAYDAEGKNIKFLSELRDHLTPAGFAVYSNEYSGRNVSLLDDAFKRYGLSVGNKPLRKKKIDIVKYYRHEPYKSTTYHAVFKITARESAPAAGGVAPPAAPQGPAITASESKIAELVAVPIIGAAIIASALLSMPWLFALFSVFSIASIPAIVQTIEARKLAIKGFKRAAEPTDSWDDIIVRFGCITGSYVYIHEKLGHGVTSNEIFAYGLEYFLSPIAIPLAYVIHGFGNILSGRLPAPADTIIKPVESPPQVISKGRVVSSTVTVKIKDTGRDELTGAHIEYKPIDENRKEIAGADTEIADIEFRALKPDEAGRVEKAIEAIKEKIKDLKDETMKQKLLERLGKGSFYVIKTPDGFFKDGIFNYWDGDYLAISEEFFKADDVTSILKIALFNTTAKDILTKEPSLIDIEVFSAEAIHEYLRGPGKKERSKPGVHELGLQDRLFGEGANEKFTKFLFSRKRFYISPRNEQVDDVIKMIEGDNRVNVCVGFKPERWEPLPDNQFAGVVEGKKIYITRKEQDMAGKYKTSTSQTIAAKKYFKRADRIFLDIARPNVDRYLAAAVALGLVDKNRYGLAKALAAFSQMGSIPLGYKGEELLKMYSASYRIIDAALKTRNQAIIEKAIRRIAEIVNNGTVPAGYDKFSTSDLQIQAKQEEYASTRTIRIGGDISFLDTTGFESGEDFPPISRFGGTAPDAPLLIRRFNRYKAVTADDGIERKSLGQAYSIDIRSGKAIKKDLKGLWDKLNEAEAEAVKKNKQDFLKSCEGWGGYSDRGGSPRDAKSKLSEYEVINIINSYLRMPIEEANKETTEEANAETTLDAYRGRAPPKTKLRIKPESSKEEVISAAERLLKEGQAAILSLERMHGFAVLVEEEKYDDAVVLLKNESAIPADADRRNVKKSLQKNRQVIISSLHCLLVQYNQASKTTRAVLEKKRICVIFGYADREAQKAGLEEHLFIPYDNTLYVNGPALIHSHRTGQGALARYLLNVVMLRAPKNDVTKHITVPKRICDDTDEFNRSFAQSLLNAKTKNLYIKAFSAMAFLCAATILVSVLCHQKAITISVWSFAVILDIIKTAYEVRYKLEKEDKGLKEYLKDWRGQEGAFKASFLSKEILMGFLAFSAFFRPAPEVIMIPVVAAYITLILFDIYKTRLDTRKETRAFRAYRTVQVIGGLLFLSGLFVGLAAGILDGSFEMWLGSDNPINVSGEIISGLNALFLSTFVYSAFSEVANMRRSILRDVEKEEVARIGAFKEPAPAAPAAAPVVPLAQQQGEQSPDMALVSEYHFIRNADLKGLIRNDVLRFRSSDNTLYAEVYQEGDEINKKGIVKPLEDTGKFNQVISRIKNIRGPPGLLTSVANSEDLKETIENIARALNKNEDWVKSQLVRIASNVDLLIVKDRLALYDNGPLAHVRRGDYSINGSLEQSAIWLGEKLFYPDISDNNIALLLLEESAHILYPDDLTHGLIKHSEAFKKFLRDKAINDYYEAPSNDMCETDMSEEITPAAPAANPPEKNRVMRLLRERNWYYRSYSPQERERLCDIIFNGLAPSAIPEIKRLAIQTMMENGITGIAANDIKAVYLYGSWCYGDDPSDIDIAVVLDDERIVVEGEHKDVKENLLFTHVPLNDADRLFARADRVVNICDFKILSRSLIRNKAKSVAQRREEAKMRGHSILVDGDEAIDEGPDDEILRDVINEYFYEARLRFGGLFEGEIISRKILSRLREAALVVWHMLGDVAARKYREEIESRMETLSAKLPKLDGEGADEDRVKIKGDTRKLVLELKNRINEILDSEVSSASSQGAGIGGASEDKFAKTALALAYAHHEIRNAFTGLILTAGLYLSPEAEVEMDEAAQKELIDYLEAVKLVSRDFERLNNDILRPAKSLEEGEGAVMAKGLIAMRNDIANLQTAFIFLRGISEDDIGAVNNNYARLIEQFDIFIPYIETGRLVLRLGEIDLSTSSNHFRSAIRQVSGMGVSVEYSPSVGTLKIQTDVRLLEVIARNIARNACEAMKGKGRLTVSISAQDDGIAISFADTGPGLAKEDLDKVWEPFWTKGKEKGTGIGLAVVKLAAEALGGRIKVESEKGKGAKFTLYLPHTPSFQAPGAVTSSTPPDLSPPSPTLAVLPVAPTPAHPAPRPSEPGIERLKYILAESKGDKVELVKKMGIDVLPKLAGSADGQMTIVRGILRDIDNSGLTKSEKNDLEYALRIVLAMQGLGDIAPNHLNVVVQFAGSGQANAGRSAGRGIERRLASPTGGYNGISEKLIIGEGIGEDDRDRMKETIRQALEAMDKADNPAEARAVFLLPANLTKLFYDVVDKDDKRIRVQQIDQGEEPDLIMQFVLGIEMLEYDRGDRTTEPIKLLNLLAAIADESQDPADILKDLFKRTFILKIRKIDWQGEEAKMKAWEAVAKSL